MIRETDSIWLELVWHLIFHQIWVPKMKLTTQWSQHISRKFSTQCLLYIICLGQLEFDNPPRWTQFDCTLTITIINIITSSGCWGCLCCLFKLAFPLELTNVINNFAFRERMQLKSNTILKQIFTATDYRENRGKMETRNQRDCPLNLSIVLSCSIWELLADDKC